VTALPAELLERALHHGLIRIDGRWRTASRDVVWGAEARALWVWCPPDHRISSVSVEYPSEESALRAALDWLDLQDPERAWKPAPWAPVVTVLRTLRGSCESLSEAPSIAAHAEAENLQEAIDLLEGALFGARRPASFEETLLVLIDYRLSQGSLGEELLDRLRLALQTHPDEAIELVDNLKIAGEWWCNERHALQHAAQTGDTELVGHVFEASDEPGWLAEVEGLPLPNGARATFPTERAAKAAVDALLQIEGYGLGGGPVLRCRGCGSDGQIGGCPDCGEEREPVEGVGDDEEPIDCPECDGEGAVHDCGEDTCNCADLSQDLVECLMCGGGGQVIP
jgi:hypothetical protein